jgi:nucleotide-binding universal stress UspA family protein
MKEGLKILVAYDESDHAKNALIEAIDLGKKYSGSITVINCAWEMSDENARAMLKKTENQLKESGVKYDLKVERTQNPPGRILRFADEGSYDLIVMGSRGMGGARAWLMGSVSNKVAAEAEVPVLVVK